MEVYILDSLYRRIAVVDKFESLIWAERMRAAGDFELHIVSSAQNRNLFVPGVNLAVNTSTRIMTVETVQDSTDDEGRRILKITGPSLENVLRHRIIAMDDAGEWVPWESDEDDPRAIATDMFHDICVTGILNAGDIISGVTEGSFYPTDTIDEPSDLIVYIPDIQDLYTGLKDLCDAYMMGFRLVRHPVTNTLYFDVYMGSDRTTAQTALGAVVFSPDLDNLRNTNRLTSSALFKNVAYVVNDTDHEVVYLDDVDPGIAGFERRVLYVSCDEGLTSEEMIQKGVDELSKNRMMSALDGQLATLTSYIYEVDYYLGDLVELRDDDGTTSNMQVTEQIFIHDKEGERAYPTLTVNTFIFPGSWVAWDFAQEWDDLTTEHWDELP
jgi:Siphovirus ReqiPepy6 Gp37-like protein